jgi:hypothetical protein
MSRVENTAPCNEPALDLLWGVNAIAAELKLNPRQAYHQLESGKLPAGKQCGRWVASRSVLRRFFAQIVAGEVQGTE